MSSKLKGTRVVLVRHGQSTYNALGLYQGSSDRSLLTKTGYTDAAKTGKFLQGIKFEAIYSSSLQRSQATAKEIFQLISPQADPNTINFTPQLRETDLPAWEGLAFEYVRENFSLDYRNWKQRPHEFCMKLGDTPQYIYPALDLYQRVRQFWQEVLPRHIGQTLLIVAHGGTNRALISTALGISSDRYHCIQQSNCGVSVLHFPDGSLASGRLEVMNLTTHVGEGLPKLQESGSGLRLLLLPLENHLNDTQQLKQLLQQVSINFSIIEDGCNFQALAKKILQDHPETVQLQVLQQDFPETWQKGLNARDTAMSFIAGLVVGQKKIVKRLISQALGMSLEHLNQLEIAPNTISCIYYPGRDYPPVLQVMNSSGVAKNLLLDCTLLKSDTHFITIKQ